MEIKLNRLITHINLEMMGDVRRYSVSAKQGDKATRHIIAKLLNEGVEYIIPDGVKVVVNVKKPDGKCVYNTCIYDGSEVDIELTNQMLAVFGTAFCDVEVRTNDDSQVITSAAFEIEIEESMRDDNAILSANEFTELENRIAGHIKNLNDTESAVKKAESGRVTAENERVAAEETRRENEAERIDKENTREQQEAERIKAENERVEAERLRQENEGKYARLAEEYSIKSQSYAVGGTGTRKGEDTDNAREYAKKAQQYSNSWKGSLLPQGTIIFAQLPTSGNIAGHMYNINNAFETDSRFKEGAGYSYPAGTNVYWTQDGKWDCLSGALTMELSQEEYDALTEAERMNGTIYYIYDADNSIEGATGDADGLMSAKDKKKLDGIAEGATRVIVDSAMDFQSENPVQNKVVTKEINDEVNRAESAESVLSDAIDAEAERAMAQEDMKAPIANPTFTGIPKAPTASAETNNTQIATTAFVKMVINALVNGAPETLDTLKEIADAITQNETVVQALNTAIGKKLNKSGDTMTGKLIANGGISLGESTTSTDLKYLLGIDAFADGGTVHWQRAELAKIGEANKWANARNINGMVIDGTANRANYGICETASNVSAKIVSCPGFALVLGAEITVKFTNPGANASPITLNVNNTGAKKITCGGNFYARVFEAGIYTFRYNGENYEYVIAGAAAKLTKQRRINLYGDVSGNFYFDGSSDVTTGIYIPRISIGLKQGKYKIASCSIEVPDKKSWYECTCIKVNRADSWGIGGMLSVVAGAYSNGSYRGPIDSGAGWEYGGEYFKDVLSFEVRDAGLDDYGGVLQELWASVKYNNTPITLLMIPMGNDYTDVNMNSWRFRSGISYDAEPDEPL